MLDRSHAVALSASRPRGTLCAGVASDPVERVRGHERRLVEGFTKAYRVRSPVWFEQTQSIEAAMARGKQIEMWNRAWKPELVVKTNPAWRDLFPEIVH